LSDEIRAPIPQKREQLVEEQQHGFGYAIRRRAATSVFDGFRDFQAEISKSSFVELCGFVNVLHTVGMFFTNVEIMVNTVQGKI